MTVLNCVFIVSRFCCYYCFTCLMMEAWLQPVLADLSNFDLYLYVWHSKGTNISDRLLFQVNIVKLWGEAPGDTRRISTIIRNPINMLAQPLIMSQRRWMEANVYWPLVSGTSPFICRLCVCCEGKRAMPGLLVFTACLSNGHVGSWKATAGQTTHIERSPGPPEDHSKWWDFTTTAHSMTTAPAHTG